MTHLGTTVSLTRVMIYSLKTTALLSLSFCFVIFPFFVVMFLLSNPPTCSFPLTLLILKTSSFLQPAFIYLSSQYFCSLLPPPQQVILSILCFFLYLSHQVRAMQHLTPLLPFLYYLFFLLFRIIICVIFFLPFFLPPNPILTYPSAPLHLASSGVALL